MVDLKQIGVKSNKLPLDPNFSFVFYKAMSD